MRIIEVIALLHELDVLEAHLEESQHFTDKIVIVESNLTYSGMKKKLFFEESRDRFSRFKTVSFDVPPDNIFIPIPGSYPKEEQKKWFDARRNNREISVKRSFNKYKIGYDYIINSDADEIWSRHHFGVIKEMMKKGYCYICPKIRRFMQYINTSGSKMNHWRIARSDMPTHTRQRGIKRDTTPVEIGWHFSGCFKAPEDIQWKEIGMCQSAGYQGVSNVHSIAEIDRRVKEGLFISPPDRGFKPTRVLPRKDVADWAPKFIADNPDLFPWYPEEGLLISDWRLPDPKNMDSWVQRLK
jgi:beta-1,4-mannosyl-glycoprotein beta-1,4-N-acetylglucosaminyltransferase